jgi:RHS repeat-associated protein
MDKHVAVAQAQVGGGSAAGGVDAGEYVFTYDANGNVAQVLDLSAGSAAAAIAAHYEYGPYGGVVNDLSGYTYAEASPIRFSTKYWDAETGLGYWGYRYYSARLGRWLSRDPIGETGGINVLVYSLNNAVDLVDPLGLVPTDVPPWLPGDNPFWPRGRASEPQPSTRPAGTITVTIQSCCTGGSASIAVGFELDRTGQLRLRYDELVTKLNRPGFTAAERSAMRDALQEQFGRLQTEFGKQFTEAWRTAHPKRRGSPGKANFKVTGYARTACHVGKACMIVGVAADVYVIVTSDDPLIQTVRAGGAIAGGYGGMLGGAWLGGKVGAACGTCAGPWGTAIGGIGGAVLGACCGEVAVEATIEWIREGRRRVPADWDPLRHGAIKGF